MSGGAGVQGMDVAGVRDLARQLQEAAGRLQEVVGRLDGQVARSSWEGRDAVVFRSDWWPSHRQQLLGTAEGLAGLGRSAANNADAQERTSSTAGGGPVGGTATVSVTPAPQSSWNQTAAAVLGAAALGSRRAADLLRSVADAADPSAPSTWSRGPSWSPTFGPHWQTSAPASWLGAGGSTHTELQAQLEPYAVAQVRGTSTSIDGDLGLGISGILGAGAGIEKAVGPWTFRTDDVIRATGDLGARVTGHAGLDGLSYDAHAGASVRAEYVQTRSLDISGIHVELGGGVGAGAGVSAGNSGEVGLLTSRAQAEYAATIYPGIVAVVTGEVEIDGAEVAADLADGFACAVEGAQSFWTRGGRQ